MSDEIRIAVFIAFGALTIVSAAIVAMARMIIHSVFALFFTFFGVAGLYVLLHADFLAATQVMIYVGGILVLLLFGVMLPHKIATVKLKSASMQRVPAAVVCLGLLGVLLFVIYKTPWPVRTLEQAVPTTKPIGKLLMTDFLLPFEVISVLLLVAVAGVVLLAKKVI